MEEIVNKFGKYLLLFLAIFIPFRELIALYAGSFIKFLPDVLVWGELLLVLINNKFKFNLKLYDYFFIGFIIIGFFSCLLNSVSFLSFALQARSIGTMYALFYVIRNINIEKNDYKTIVNVLMSVNIVIIIFAILEFFTDKTLFFPKIWAENINFVSNFERTYSLMDNPNTFGIFTFMVMFLVYFANKDSFSKKYFGYYILSFLGIILSASRSTLLVVCLFILFLIYESIKKRSCYNLLWFVILIVLSFGIVYSFEKIKLKMEIMNSTEIPNKKPNGNSSDCVSDGDINDNIVKPITPGFTLLDRIKETTSGTTAANSKVNGRLYIIKKGLVIFKDYPLIGTGFGTFGSAASKMITPDIYSKYNLSSNFYSDNEYIKVVVETGIIGTIIFGLFILSLFYEFFKTKSYYKLFIFIVFLFIGMFYNVFEMQVMCYVLYLSFMFLENDYFKKEINNKKISILSLHLGFGGVEQVVTNTANMLSNDYDVEIVSLYKSKENIPFKVNEKVKITYLSNLISNRAEFKAAVKNKKIFKIIKEGIKAIYILINKNQLMRSYILKSDAKVIISSRYSFSKILNYCGRDNSYKIHHEHTFSVNDKYINNLNKLKKINEVIVVSQTLYDEYKNKLNIKLKYIPNALNYYPKESELSKLNNKNLIAVGRMSPEKGFTDLIDVIKKIDDKEVILNLFGDGQELEFLKNKVKELNLEKQIYFYEFKTQDFIKKYMQKSSLYVMTSFEESFGLVLIEAMSYGVPCIAFDSAQGAKYIINHKNGYFIKNRNIEEMANTIKKYLKLNCKDKLMYGTNARNTSNEYVFNNIQSKWLKHIKVIMEEK
ncbi:MAG: glycosyltransferase [Firmicutes bacterium]|nr:glycosyltransferase [Bacillota bacterium]